MGSSASTATGIVTGGIETVTGLPGQATSLLPPNPVTDLIKPLSGQVADVGKTLTQPLESIPGLDSLTGTLTALPGSIEKNSNRIS